MYLVKDWVFALLVGWSVCGISFLSYLGAVLSRFVDGVGMWVAGLSCVADMGCYAVLSRNWVDTLNEWEDGGGYRF